MSTLHQPTPTQVRLSAERKERLSRIASRALVQEVAVLAKEQLAEDAAPTMTIKQAEQWMAEQLAQVTQSAVAKLWFAIADKPGEVSINTIQNVVSTHFRVSRRDLVSARRSADIVLPRHVAFYLCKILTHKSFPGIGRKFGGRDHTTVLHGVRRISGLIASGHPIRRDVNILIEILDKMAGPDDADDNTRLASASVCQQDPPDRLA